MNAPAGQAWIRTAILFGVGYFVIGKVFSLPTEHVQLWRLAAWVASGVIYAAHIRYEHFTLCNSPRFAAQHVAVGVAIGAFALAVAGMIHSVLATSAIRPTWLLALVLWPAFTAVPAFLGAFVIGSLLPSRSQR
jgi:hypothetical protein